MGVVMAAVLRLFNSVPECLIETLLIVHGSGDRNSPEFTQVCETWTRILAPWVRTLKDRDWPCGKEHARWNGKCYRWYPSDELCEKLSYDNGKKEGVWHVWYETGKLWQKSVHMDGKMNGLLQSWYENNGQLKQKCIYVQGKMNEWLYWGYYGELLESGFRGCGDMTDMAWPDSAASMCVNK